MKKVLLVLLGCILATSILMAQEAKPTTETTKVTKEYVKKAIKTESGYDAECWVVIGIWLDLKANSGSITLDGYKDFATKEAGGQCMGRKTVEIKDLTTMESYPAVRGNVLTLLSTNPQFSGASIEAVEVEIKKETTEEPPTEEIKE